MLRDNRYDEESGELLFTAEQVAAFEASSQYYADSSARTPQVRPDSQG